MAERISGCGPWPWLMMMGLTVTGCASPRTGDNAGQSDAGRTSPLTDAVEGLWGASPSRTGGERPAGLRVVNLVFDIVHIDLPVGRFRHSAKVWNHVDELRVDADLAARLARNGLRMGVASSDAWTAIRTILEVAEADVRRDQLATQGGLPLSLLLSSLSEPETIFTYDGKGRLAGRTVPVGNKLLNIEHVYHPELGGCTDVRLAFEIRHDRGVMTWERHGDAIRQVPAYDRLIFGDLETSLMVKPGEFVVIGLSEHGATEYMLGRRFLSSTRGSKDYETLICITPHPFESTMSVEHDPEHK